MKKTLSIIFSLLFYLIVFSSSVFASTAIDLFQVTSSGQREDWAVIDKDTILWIDPRDGGTVYAYNAKEKREYPFFPNGLPIPNLFGLVQYDGRYLAYNRITDQNAYDVGIYDTRRKQDIPITNEAGSQTATDFDQGTVVYIDGYACGKLYAYDMRRKRKTLITETACGSVRISESTVVWGYAAPGGTDIYGYDLRRNKQFTITDADGIQDSPDIEGNNVIWVSNDVDGQSIHLKNIRTGVEKVLLQTSSYGVSWPAISKDYAIWAKIIEPHVTGVEGINLTTGEIFEVQAPGPQQNSNLSSVIEGNLAAWMSWRTGNGDIYGAYINP